MQMSHGRQRKGHIHNYRKQLLASYFDYQLAVYDTCIRNINVQQQLLFTTYFKHVVYIKYKIDKIWLAIILVVIIRIVYHLQAYDCAGLLVQSELNNSMLVISYTLYIQAQFISSIHSQSPVLPHLAMSPHVLSIGRNLLKIYILRDLVPYIQNCP